VTLYVVLSAIDAYVAEVSVVEVVAIFSRVPSNVAPVELYICTVYEVLFETAPHDTSIDFAVEAVAMAVTEAGVERTVGADRTYTGVGCCVSVPVPKTPSPPPPQHLIVVSCKTAHEKYSPAEI
jgi:hypothetical protein